MAQPSDSEQPVLFEVDDLHVRVVDEAETEREILKGLSLRVGAGEVHAIMGPNGSGKSTLASTLLANPAYEITSGTLRFKGEDISDWPVDTRARAGIFLAFQYPQEVPGVPVSQFLRQAMGARKEIGDYSVLEARLAMMSWMDKLGMDHAFMNRHLNDGFSGGEKKRNEILQMALLEPEIAILDETDSGLDIDALRVVGHGVQTVRAERPQMGVVVITHYVRMLDHLRPDVVHIMLDGRIVDSGGPELADQIEQEGYDAWRARA